MEDSVVKILSSSERLRSDGKANMLSCIWIVDRERMVE